jgi:glycosyltransferase involved in cell wall biosynthesis
MKIAIFHLAFVYSGGGERLVLEEAQGLEKAGHQVAIFSPAVDKKSCFPDITEQFEIKTFLPPLPSFFPEWQSLQVLLTCTLMPFLAHRFKGYQAILAANQPSLWLAGIVKTLYKVPYVAYLAQPTRFLYPREVDREVGLRFIRKRVFSPAILLMSLARPLIRWADKVSVQGADLVLANGEYMSGVLEKTYQISALSCPAGAHPAKSIKSYQERLTGQLEIEGQMIQKPYLLLTNRHFPQKKFEYALFALDEVLKDFPNLRLAVTGGETVYTKKLKQLVRKRSLEEKVLFLGFVSEDALEALYRQAAVYLYTAPEEDFGMGMVEAMAHGTPVVAWNRAGPTGIISDGVTGLLARPLEVTDFAAKIARILGDRKLGREMGLAAWEEAKRRFAYKEHVRVIEKGLLGVLAD